MDEGIFQLARAKLAVIDIETTGLDPLQDELIGLTLVCIEVDRLSGTLLTTMESYSGQRELTQPMSASLEHMLGLSAAELTGKVLDIHRISSLLQGCELVIAHNAAFDRSFIEPHIPDCEQWVWSCSLKDIDWFGTEQQPSASIDHLLRLHGLAASKATTLADCQSLICILGAPLPVSGGTGFAALLASADSSTRSV